jgi:hypothetical protein
MSDELKIGACLDDVHIAIKSVLEQATNCTYLFQSPADCGLPSGSLSRLFFLYHLALTDMRLVSNLGSPIVQLDKVAWLYHLSHYLQHQSPRKIWWKVLSPRGRDQNLNPRKMDTAATEK